MAKGAAWMVSLKVVERCIGLVSMVVLARILIPADYGLMSMAWSIIQVLEVMGTFRFYLAIIQIKKADRRHYDTAWTYTVIVAIVTCLLLVLLAIPSSLFYNDYRLEYIMYVLAIGTFFQGFENVGVVAFQKEINLRLEFIFQITKKIILFIVTIGCAVVYRNYWALVVGTVASKVLGVAFSYFIHPYRPKFSLGGRKELFNFSKWMLLNNIMIFINNRSVDFILGKMAGAAALGTYSMSSEIANLPTTELVWPIGRALFPGFVKLVHDMELFRKSFLNSLGLIITFALPAGIGIGVLSEQLIYVVLGEKWAGAVHVMQILAVYGSIRACFTSIGSVFLALGLPKLISKLAILNIVILIPMLFWAVPIWGATGAALSMLIALVIQFNCYYLILMKILKLRFFQIFAVAWRPLCATFIMALIIDLTNRITILYYHNVWQLLSCVVTGMVVYVVFILYLWKLFGSPSGAESLILGFVKSRMSNLQFLKRSRFKKDAQQ